MNLVRSLPLLALAAITVVTSAQTVMSRATPPESTAELIKVSGELAQLKKLSPNVTAADRWQVLWLHQRISEQVTAASLQVDATVAQIDNEIARANEVRGYLSDRRDRAVSRTNLLGILLGGAVGATASGLQLSSNLTKPAAGVGIGAGALSAGIALTGIREEKGRNSTFEFQSNMLAEFFDRPMLPNSRYPETIWIFLNESSPSGPPGITRKEDLLQNWVQVRRIDSLSSKEKIDHLTSEPAEDLKLSIDDFEDRSAMLQDVRARISYLKRDLGELLTSLPPVEIQP
ncbi:MAG TPA: hypothetical protein VMB49_15455 [Acidobacteriaceae bacterium]|nr:hypothetical protein [Acidobacteriaceae bacterium]